jgi:hypothetical protein
MASTQPTSVAVAPKRSTSNNARAGLRKANCSPQSRAAVGMSRRLTPSTFAELWQLSSAPWPTFLPPNFLCCTRFG